MADEDPTATAVEDPAAPDGVAEQQEQPEEPPTVTLPKAEADALRKRLAEAERAQRRLEADRKKAEETRQAEEGKYRELAEQREREVEQERSERFRMERDQRVARIASRLRFIDPSDVVGRVSAEDGAEDHLAEAALQRIADASPHLVAKEPAARPEIGQVHGPGGTADGKPPPPAGRAPLRTLDEAEQLPQSEQMARMDEIDWLLANESKRR